MNSLVSETKVVCNESIPNPITPVPIPIPIIPAPDADTATKAITVLNGHHIKAKKGSPMNTEQNASSDISSDLSSMSPSEPMDCNSTPNVSPAHVVKNATSSSNEDVAMSENTSVRIMLLLNLEYLCSY